MATLLRMLRITRMHRHHAAANTGQVPAVCNVETGPRSNDRPQRASHGHHIFVSGMIYASPYAFRSEMGGLIIDRRS